ncbi:hypothetical protein LguiA_035788 [Lonicera macranthoides]
MANPVYGYNPNSYGGGASNVYPSSEYIADPYYNSSSSSSRYLAGSSMLFSHHPDGAYSAGSRTPGGGGYFASQQQASSWPGPPGVVDHLGLGPHSLDQTLFAAGYKRPSSSEMLYHQTVMGAHNPIGHTEAWFSTNPSAKRPRLESATNLPIYPQRPGEKDCAHYMLTRTCKFGDSCKFDHPIWVPEGGIPDWKEVPLDATSETLPERPGEPDCPYFLKTQRCKFGLRCKFNHPKDKLVPLGALESVDVSILPERPSEPPCTFYTKTGKCKFGATCKFNHPKDSVIPLAQPENGSVGQNEVSKHETTGDLNQVKPLFAPALLHNSKGLPVRPGEVDCPFYLKTGSCKYGATCRYNHPDINAIIPPGVGSAFIASPVPPHFNVSVVNPSASVLQTIDPRLTQSTLGMIPAIYPQRPGEIECDFYMKTGECKFGERCKYHHPIDRSVQPLSVKEAQQQNVKLTLAGLPRREGSVNCPYYMKTGTCKYGATCKFDHPPPGEVMAMATPTATSVGGDNE